MASLHEGPPDWVLAEVQELAETRTLLEEERDLMATNGNVEQTAEEVLSTIRSGRQTDLLTHPPEVQAAVWRRLICRAYFDVGGTSGKGRTTTAELVPIAARAV